jgi:hypothetical protein
MVSLCRLVDAVASLFGNWALEAAQASNVIQRERKLTAQSLAATFTLGFLGSPNASCEELAQMSALVGEPVTPQAIDQRQHSRMVDFLRRLFEKAVQNQVPSDRCLGELVERFADVQILDSTTVSLPIEMANEFPGCGNNHGGASALKLQVRMSLKTGVLDAVHVEAGRDCDVKTPLQDDVPIAGSLRIADLGYFDTEVFENIEKAGAFWLSPLLPRTNVYDDIEDENGAKLDLFDWLESNGPVIDRPVRIASRRLPCRLIAWRLPPEVAARRRRKLRAQVRRKEGKGAVPSAERLARCDWAILLTNVPQERLSIDEARVLYRARWQIELLFKRWKSQGWIDEMDSTPIRCMVKLWSRLLAALVQQWLQSRLWGRPEISLKKAWDLISRLATSLAMAWSTWLTDGGGGLHDAIEKIERIAQTTARQNKRKRSSTFDLLSDPSRPLYA